MSLVAIIGGTGLTKLENLEITHKEMVNTPYGVPSGPLTFGKICGLDVVFLARHGYRHTIPPHMVNYRANLWALKEAGASKIIAVAAVGGITSEMKPEAIVIPDQIIDYTYGRSQTFFENDLSFVTHIDFSYPYNDSLRQILLKSAEQLNYDAVNGAVYAATQGPRLETAAEINRLDHDGCDIVGMTGMPEAALARELELEYAACALVVNWAAGRNGGNEISLSEMEKCLEAGMARVRGLLEIALPMICHA
ncbi:MAG: S-methyl-5'-thioinosine phosphorylase [Gammaproteobacteria bacterium]|nr:S-methyl-5'-thioinosine phosphorylase [Gammaproteobacteria bacterium]MCW8911416.1 S-methyl-5'-thioinosine phosphorylase [Gammaproteobacteria bacterium]MCW9003989.1 S-methyl-5'-thioinosine phosphorylase [Gammaproteobacteria bacterium]